MDKWESDDWGNLTDYIAKNLHLNNYKDDYKEIKKIIDSTEKFKHANTSRSRFTVPKRTVSQPAQRKSLSKAKDTSPALAEMVNG